MIAQSTEIYRVFVANCQQQTIFFASIVNLTTELSKEEFPSDGNKVELYCQIEDYLYKWKRLVEENSSLVDKFQRLAESSPAQLDRYQKIEMSLAAQLYVISCINELSLEDWFNSSSDFVVWNALLKYNGKPLLQLKKKS